MNLSPLRERPADVPLLARHFVDRLAARHRVPVPELTDEALAALAAHPWPGNVRELRNVLERAVVVRGGSRFARRTSLWPTPVRPVLAFARPVAPRAGGAPGGASPDGGPEGRGRPAPRDLRPDALLPAEAVGHRLTLFRGVGLHPACSATAGPAAGRDDARPGAKAQSALWSWVVVDVPPRAGDWHRPWIRRSSGRRERAAEETSKEPNMKKTAFAALLLLAAPLVAQSGPGRGPGNGAGEPGHRNAGGPRRLPARDLRRVASEGGAQLRRNRPAALPARGGEARPRRLPGSLRRERRPLLREHRRGRAAAHGRGEAPPRPLRPRGPGRRRRRRASSRTPGSPRSTPTSSLAGRCRSSRR